jgi:hypothetical protein
MIIVLNNMTVLFLLKRKIFIKRKFYGIHNLTSECTMTLIYSSAIYYSV